MKIDYEMLGERIRRRRKEQDMTQEQLAERTKRSTAFIGHIERGSRIMSLETLCEIALALDCTTDELLGLELKDIDVDRSVQELLKLAQKLLEEKKQKQCKTSCP